ENDERARDRRRRYGDQGRARGRGGGTAARRAPQDPDPAAGDAGGDRGGHRWGVELVGCTFDALFHHGHPLARLYAPCSRLRVQNAVARAPFVHYVTAEFLQKRYPSTGIEAAFSDVSLPTPCPAVLDRRLARIRDRRGPVIFGLIGTLKVRYKGVHLALRALSHVRRLLPDFLFRVLGPGDPRPWRQQARALGLGRHVIFDGVLPAGDEVLRWLDGLDVYLQPSLAEALPRGLIEAMSRGLPALGSTAGEIPTLLDERCLHEPGDWRRLATQLVGTTRRGWRVEEGVRNFGRARDFAPGLLAQPKKRWLARVSLPTR
ncbi:MAG: glycosyltransferase family 4 protein, partial [Bradymonadaceae bacterium]